MLAESAKNLVPKFFDETGTTYDGVVSYGTLGKDKYWKKKILQQISNGNSFLWKYFISVTVLIINVLF